MKKYIITIVVLLGFAFTSQNVISQNPTTKAETGALEPYNYLGGYLHYNMNLHSADFRSLPGCFNCSPGFDSGFGNGFSIGGLFEIPIAEKFYLGIRLGYSMMNAKLSKEEIIGNALEAGIIGNATSRINVEHTIDSKLSAAVFEPQVFYNFYDNFTGAFGLKGAFMLNKTFSQKEEILSPNNLVFKETGQITRAVYDEQDIPEAKSFITFATLGLAYNLKLESGMLIVPELRYELALYSLTSVKWSPNAINLGVAVKFPMRPSIKPTFDSVFIQRDTSLILAKGIAEPIVKLMDTKRTTAQIEYDDYYLNRTDIIEFYTKEMTNLPDAPIADITLKGLNYDGTYLEMPELIIEELETEETFPLLPQVFFAKNSADLTKTNLNLLTAEQAKSFDEAKIHWDALSIYRDMLNIIAKRAKDNENARFTITGCNNDAAEEAGNLSLSKARAEAIRDYFAEVWGINQKQISIETRNLPEKPANNLRPQGLEENRRAEINSDNPEILKPIRMSAIQRSANPPIVRIIPKVQTTDKIENWNIDIIQDDTKIRAYNGSGKPDSIDWTVEINPVPMLEAPINAKLTAKDSYGQSATAEETIKIQQKTIKKKKIEMLGDKRIDRFSLILFDYDKSEITERQKEIINEIKAKIKANSTVTITGFTDKTGEPSYNRKLALERATQAETLLGISDKSRVKVKAADTNYELYDNDLPEGRSYSRTVRIIIETPD